MKDPDENSFSNGDWENQSELYWNEKEWNSYLKENVSEQAKFLSLYLGLREHPSRLDLAARQMGWESGNWAPGNEENAKGTNEDAETQPVPKVPPYCVQQHPVFIVTRSFCVYLSRTLKKFCDSSAGVNLPASLVLRLTQALHETEHAMIMSITAMDTADFSLSLCLSKHTLTGINQTLGFLDVFEGNPSFEELVQEFRFILFDFRELALRLIGDASWELSNPAEGE